MRYKKRYLKDYEVKLTKTKDGKQKQSVVYVGEYFNYDVAPQTVCKTKWTMLSFFIFIISVLLTGFFINSLSAYKIYVVLPQVLLLISILKSLYHASIMFSKKIDFTRAEKDTFIKLSTNLKINIVFSAVLITSYTVFFIINLSYIKLAWEIPTLIITLIMLVLNVIIFALFNKIKLKQKDNKESENKDNSNDSICHGNLSHEQE